LLPRSRMFSGKSMYESDFMQDWLDTKKELAPISVASIDDHKHRQKMTLDAKKRSKSSKNITFTEKTKDVRQRRQEELRATTNMLEKNTDTRKTLDISKSNDVIGKVVSLPIGRKRRTKGDQS
jgi:putative transposase